MAYKISIPFFAFRLQFSSGARLTMPLADKTSVQLNEPMPAIARRYAEALQKQMLDQGHFTALMEEYSHGPFYWGQLDLDFPGSPDGISFPPFQLKFDYYFFSNGNGFGGVVPALGLEAFSASQEGLEQQLSEVIRLEFTRKRRLNFVQRIVASIWFEEIELKQASMDLIMPTPRELEKLADTPTEELLPKVAQLLQVQTRQLFGLKEVFEQLVAALKDQFNRNVLLVGPSGVGKTTLVWETARQLKKHGIKGNIWETTASVLIKELIRDTDWQDNITYLCRELSQRGDWLYVRNLMELFEVGQSISNDISVAAYLRTFINRGEVTLIAECTEEELARIELQNSNFSALFRIIRITVPEGKQLEKIILRKSEKLALTMGIPIGELAIPELIRLNRRFNPYSGLPGKPIRFMESLLLSRNKRPEEYPLGVSRTDVIRAFCEESGLPVFMVDPEIQFKTEHVEAFFHRNLFGQHKAVASIVQLLVSVKAALVKSGKPIASLLFVGPTGVGKTEMAKLLAEFMFGHRERLIRFDMSEFSDYYAVARLTGLDSSQEGLLTAAIRQTPFSVVLFDEVEKADSSFYDLLLQIMSEGRLTSSQGQTVNFCSSIIILTSNIGAEKVRQGAIRLGHQNDHSKETQQIFLREVQRYFRPEFYNRIDQVIPFAPLGREVMGAIVDREIDLVFQREGIRFRRLDIKIQPEVYDYLALEGYDAVYGARHLQRTIRKQLIIPLSKALNSQDFDEQIIVSVFLQKETIIIETEMDPLGLDLLIEELEKDSYADLASTLRRSLHRLAEGHCYINMLNDLALMERGKQEDEKAFWANEQVARKYHTLLRLQQRLEDLSKEVEELETSVGLACLGIEKYRPQVNLQLEEWEEKLQVFKIDMLSRVEPKLNYCHLAIYGKENDAIVAFYQELFESRGWKYSAQYVWFRESYYNEAMWQWTAAGEKSSKSGTEEGAYVKQKREGYIKTNTDLSQPDLPIPPKAGDQLCGIEFAISGPCAFLYLKNEGGTQKWVADDGIARMFMVQVEQDAFTTPAKIHRQEFYKQYPLRRTITTDHVRDQILKIQREFGKGQLLALPMTQQMEQFLSAVEETIS